MPSSTLALTLTLSLACLSLACTDKGSGDDTGRRPGDGGATTTGDVNLSLATISTTGVARWTTDPSATRAWVTFGVAGDTTWTSEATLVDGRARALLVGMRPGLDHDVTVFEQRGDDEVVVHSDVLTAGDPPGSLPSSDFLADEAGRHQQFMVSSLLVTPSMPVILNSLGEFVWWHEPVLQGHVSTRAWVAWDGSGVHYISRPSPTTTEDRDEGTWLVKVDWTGDSVETIELDHVHHDFLELDDGTVVYLAEDVLIDDGAPYVGDRIMERAPDGTTTQIWSVWDTYSLAEDTPDEVEGTNWSHANAIDFDESSQTYSLSLRNFNAIVGISRETGEKDWQIGGIRSDYAQIGADSFNWQHQFEWLTDGNLLVFDNGNTERLFSRAMEYSLDADAGQVEAVWEHISTPPAFCYGPGDVHRLDNGNTLVGWGSSGRFQEVTADGDVVWDQVFGVGGVFGYASWVDDLNAR